MCDRRPSVPKPQPLNSVRQAFDSQQGGSQAKTRAMTGDDERLDDAALLEAEDVELAHLEGPVSWGPSRGRGLAVLGGEVVPEGAGGCCPSERPVGSMVIVEVDEAGVAGAAFAL